MPATYTEKLSQQLNVIGAYYPASIGASTVLTGAIDLAKHRRVLFLIITGVLGSSATVDFKITQAATSGGTYSDISGKAITQLVKASNDNNIALVEVAAEELSAGKEFIKGSITVGTAASILCVIALAASDRYSPSADNLAAVVQTI